MQHNKEGKLFFSCDFNKVNSYGVVVPDLQRFVIGGRNKQVGVWRPGHIRDPLHTQEHTEPGSEPQPGLDLDQDLDSLTSLCPTMDFSNFPSNAPQIFISLSAAAQRCYHGYHSITSQTLQMNMTPPPNSSVSLNTSQFSNMMHLLDKKTSKMKKKNNNQTINNDLIKSLAACQRDTDQTGTYVPQQHN